MRKPNTCCSDCDKPIYRRPNEFLIRKDFFCRSCQKKHMDVPAKIKNNTTYSIYIENWKNGIVDGMRGQYQTSRHIERYLREKYDNECSQCGWHEVNPYTGNIPLEIEHIDGNFKNNKEENLILLCPSCHSLTPTYKGANRGKGRKERKNMPS